MLWKTMLFRFSLLYKRFVKESTNIREVNTSGGIMAILQPRIRCTQRQLQMQSVCYCSCYKLLLHFQHESSLMINLIVVNIPHSPIWMSVVDEHWHSLCGSGAVYSVSIGDRVELDRLWLPSLLHVTHKKPAGAQTNEVYGWKPAEEELSCSSRRCQVTRHGLTDEDTQRCSHELA